MIVVRHICELLFVLSGKCFGSDPLNQMLDETKMSSCSVCLLMICSMKHSNCYMVWGGDLVSNQQTRFSQEDMVVGCLVDLATGLMTFTANGKEINTFYQVRKAYTACVTFRCPFKSFWLSCVTVELCCFRWSPTPNCSLQSLFSQPIRTWHSWSWENSRSEAS